MDNMRARMRMPEREAAKAGASVQDDSRRYTSPRPAVAPQRKNKLAMTKWLGLLLVVIVVAGLAIGIFKYSGGAGEDGIDHSKYQAVFLSNGTITNNVYFGKLERMSDGYYKLNDAFYVKAAATTEENKDSNDITLTKLGSELYGPQDTLIIPREQVLYYQNMKDDSQVTEAIKKYTKENK